MLFVDDVNALSSSGCQRLSGPSPEPSESIGRISLDLLDLPKNVDFLSFPGKNANFELFPVPTFLKFARLSIPELNRFEYPTASDTFEVLDEVFED